MAGEEQHDGKGAGLDKELLREVRRLQIRTDRLVTDLVSGGYSSVFRGAGIEFDEVREWTEGDDFRSVDWNVTARQGRPFIKKFVEERELTLLVLLDRSRSMRFGSRPDGRSLARIAAEFVATIGVSATRSGDKLGFLSFGSARQELYLPPKKGRSQLMRLLRECLCEPARELSPEEEDAALQRALAYAGRVQRKRAIVFVVSDFLLSLPRRELALLSKRHDLTLVSCSDPRLREIPAGGLLRVIDLESGQERLVDTRSAKLRQRYAEQARERSEQLAATARRAGAGLLALSTERPVGGDILGFFRRREMRGRHR
ncbi:MAG: DUF58 domain-containing protein [Planctomycetota bacterium]|nr:MAG: DUF58 domain-containing protein [Planctomycetota bacterium]